MKQIKRDWHGLACLAHCLKQDSSERSLHRSHHLALCEMPLQEFATDLGRRPPYTSTVTVVAAMTDLGRR